jgi:hypothetical protein
MLLVRRLAQQCVMLAVISVSMVAPVFAQNVSAADIAKLQESVRAMREQYEQRINSLERKIETLQKVQATRPQITPMAGSTTPARTSGAAPSTPANTVMVASTNALVEPVNPQASAPTPTPTPTPQQARVVTRNPPSSLGSGITLPKMGAVTPEISLILDGKYSSQSQNPESFRRGFIPSGGESVARGFSLGESEFAIAGTVDNLFRAEARLVLGQEGSNFHVALEEAFFETINMPAGLKIKGGKFFSSVGYLNNKHPHEWDFVDLPLAYKAFFGGQLNNTGAQLSWVAPTDKIYLRFGAELGQGMHYPNSDNFNQNKPRLGTVYAKAGGDINESSSWLGGLSFVSASTGNRPSISMFNDTDSFDFKGNTNILIADFVYKWAPNGNASSQNLKLQAEGFWNTQNGSATLSGQGPYGGCDAPCIGNSYTNTQSGFYVQAIYQFMPRWRIGYRFDQLFAGNSNYGFSPGTLDGTPIEPWNPTRNTLMLDWANSENSMFRLQLARDTVYGPNMPNNQIFLQYIMSLGAHGAHRF